MKMLKDVRLKIKQLEQQLQSIHEAQAGYLEREGLIRNELQNLYNRLDKGAMIS